MLSKKDNNSRNKNKDSSSYKSETKKKGIINKNYLLNSDIITDNKRKSFPMFIGQKEQSRKKFSNIKIKNNKIINNINENIYYNLRKNENIDFQSIFIKQFINNKITNE